jgi:hypothetical protein
MKKLMIPVTLVVLLALGLAVSQEEPHEAPNGEHYDLEVLDRNIRLTFKLLDEEGKGDEPMSIVTAVTQFKLEARAKNDDGHTAVLLTGAAGPRNDGRILVLLEMEAASADHNGETELAVECGVLLEPGKEREVAEWGDRTLVVHANYVD